MKITPTAGCIAGGGRALGIPATATHSQPGLALVLLLGVSVFGLVAFMLGMRG